MADPYNIPRGENGEPFPLMRSSSDALMTALVGSLGRIEAKVDENQRIAEEYRNATNKAFSDHVAEERIRQSAIDNRMLEFERMLSTHHQDIMRAVQEINVVEAIPRSDDGKPDIHGHRNEHEYNRRASDKRRDWIESVIKDGLRWVLGAIALAAVYGVWTALLQGPPR